MKSSTVLTLLLVVAFVTGVATYYITGVGKSPSLTTAPKISDPFDIEFGVEGVNDKAKLVITKAACTGRTPQAKGCLKVSRGRSGVVTFKFNASPPWELKELTICRGSTKDRQKCDLSIWERMEFAVADAVLQTNGKYKPGSTLAHIQDDGSIDLSELVPGAESTEFILLDVNSIRKEYFYNIKACYAPDHCITLDPPLDNRGRD